MTKSVLVFFILIVAVGVTGWALYLKGGGADADNLNATESPMAQEETTGEAAEPEVRTLQGGLQVQDLKVGGGDEASAGQMVTVHYTGWLTDGTKFDSSVDRGQPFQFPLGAGQVIPGWDLGVAGMKVGGVRKLTIPPALAYGERGAGGVIPANATLVFEVQLLAIAPK